jgi:hypothetical protein
MEYLYSFLWFMLGQVIFAFTLGQILLPIFVGIPRHRKALKSGEFSGNPSRRRLFIAPVIWAIILITILFFIIKYRDGKYYEFLAAFVLAIYIFFKNLKSEKSIIGCEKDFQNMYRKELK